MPWQSSTPAAAAQVTWYTTGNYQKTGNSAKTWNHFRLYWQCASARLGANYYIRMRIRWTAEGQNGPSSYSPRTCVYFAPERNLQIKSGAWATRSKAWSQYYYYVKEGNATTVTMSIGPNTANVGTGFPSWTLRIPARVLYTLNYTNGGYGTAPDPQTKDQNVAIALRSFIPVQGGGTNYVQITGNANGGSWTGSHGSASYTTTKCQQTAWRTGSTDYGSGANYTANASATFAAIWTVTNPVGTNYVLPTGTPTHANTTTSSYTVSYNANGGNSTPSTQTSTRTVTYSFGGWHTHATNATTVTNSRRVIAAETLYAHYNPTVGAQPAITLAGAITKSDTTETGYKVNFNKNATDAILSRTSSNATRIYQYTFEKWHAGSASGTGYSASSSYTPTGNVTMYANFTQSVKSQGYVMLPSSTECTRDGYILLGWATSANATSVEYGANTQYWPQSDNVTLYAVWGQIDRAYLDDETVAICIYNGTNWDKYSAWIHNGTTWERYS